MRWDATKDVTIIRSLPIHLTQSREKCAKNKAKQKFMAKIGENIKICALCVYVLCTMVQRHKERKRERWECCIYMEWHECRRDSYFPCHCRQQWRRWLLGASIVFFFLFFDARKIFVVCSQYNAYEPNVFAGIRIQNDRHKAYKYSYVSSITSIESFGNPRKIFGIQPEGMLKLNAIKRRINVYDSVACLAL